MGTRSRRPRNSTKTTFPQLTAALHRRHYAFSPFLTLLLYYRTFIHCLTPSQCPPQLYLQHIYWFAEAQTFVQLLYLGARVPHSPHGLCVANISFTFQYFGIAPRYLFLTLPVFSSPLLTRRTNVGCLTAYNLKCSCIFQQVQNHLRCTFCTICPLQQATQYYSQAPRHSFAEATSRNSCAARTCKSTLLVRQCERIS